MRVTLTRRVTFAAAHRYHRPEWTEAQNRAVFGACAAGHVTTVTVAEDDTLWSTCHAE